MKPGSIIAVPRSLRAAYAIEPAAAPRGASPPRPRPAPTIAVLLLVTALATSNAWPIDAANAVRAMSLPGDLRAQCVAAEPLITQPVCIEFDPRGRLWVVQYIQYPNPAGLQRATVDRWSRTTYDRVPEPPPHGPRGSDRITLLIDRDGDGLAESSKDFVNGLNLASGIAFGHAGMFVLNVPYLLFYPDRNQDDVPDADPEVCLSGFGMEDAHSVANSLTWGPDGWLYGCQGSTVTSRIRGVEFQQGVWRYHPLTRQFELFCEGGGNSWGLDFDPEGELIYSTNVGGYRAVHGVQGAYYWKSFGKHGALHNPYAFGWFDHIPHSGFTGGHVTVGGLVYTGTNLPPRFPGRYLSGDLLGHGVQWHALSKRGSTFTSSHGGDLLRANDRSFASSDLTTGPDGALYVADWHDQRTAHPDPDAEWDRSNGRVYRITGAHAAGPAPPLPNFRTASPSDLLTLLLNPNPWIVKQARRAFADHPNRAAIPLLRTALLDTPDDRLALECLWALHANGGLDDTTATRTLRHRSPAVRKWTIRLLADRRELPARLAAPCVALAAAEQDPTVRAQLAASAKRLPPGQAIPILHAMIPRDADAADPFIPLLLWWAVETHAVRALPAVEHSLATASAWRSTLARETLLPRLIRRWSAERSTSSLDAAARLLRSAPSDRDRQELLAGMALGFRDRPTAPAGFGTGGLFARSSAPDLATRPQPRLAPRVPRLLRDQVRRLEAPTNLPWLTVAAFIGDPDAPAHTLALATNPATPSPLRVDAIGLLADRTDPAHVQPLARLAAGADAPGGPPPEVRIAALDALAGFDAPAIAAPLIARYSALEPRVRSRLREVLLSRKSWTRELLAAVDARLIPAADFAPDQLRLAALHDDPVSQALILRHWGSFTRGTREEQLAEMRRLNNDLNAGAGEPRRGRLVFQKLCAPCHQLFGPGGQVGPDLTHANRADREFLLASIVDPSAAIRKEHLAHEISTDDGRLLTGVILEQSGAQLTLGLGTGERTVIPTARVKALRDSPISLMPAGLLAGLSPQDIRDLFAFLQLPTDIP